MKLTPIKNKICQVFLIFCNEKEILLIFSYYWNILLVYCFEFNIFGGEKYKMKVTPQGVNFNGVYVSKRITPIHNMYLEGLDKLGQSAFGLDVFIKSVTRSLPYRTGTMPVSAIEVSARPEGASFLERLFKKNTVTEYFPTGNIGELIRGKDTFADVFARAVSKAKQSA